MCSAAHPSMRTAFFRRTVLLRRTKVFKTLMFLRRTTLFRRTILFRRTMLVRRTMPRSADPLAELHGDHIAQLIPTILCQFHLWRKTNQKNDSSQKKDAWGRMDFLRWNASNPRIPHSPKFPYFCPVWKFSIRLKIITETVSFTVERFIAGEWFS